MSISQLLSFVPSIECHSWNPTAIEPLAAEIYLHEPLASFGVSISVHATE